MAGCDISEAHRFVGSHLGAGAHNCPFLGPTASSKPPGELLELGQNLQRCSMNGFSDWFDNNWVDLARLFVQCGILASVVWYGRNILKTLRASQEQIGALLRLSLSGGAAHEQGSSIAEPALAPPGFAAPVSVGADKNERALTPSPAYAGSLQGAASYYFPEREQSLGGRIAAETAIVNEPEPVRAETPNLTPWVAAPTTQVVEPAEGLAARMADSQRNLGRWLKEPPRRSSGVNPIRRMIRWLQTPAGSRTA